MFKIAGGRGRLKVSWQVTGEPKPGGVVAEHPQEKPFDERMAQQYRRQAKELMRHVVQLREETRRRRARR